MNINKSLHSFHKEFLNFNNLYEDNNLSNSIMISGHDGIGKRTFATHFALFCLMKDEDRKKYLINFEINDINLLKQLESNFFLQINFLKKKENKNLILVEEIRNVINFCSMQSFNNAPKFIIVNNAEHLNINSSNAILKILETPPENTYFILLNNSNHKVLDTIKSRCRKFLFKINMNTSNKIFNKLSISKDHIDFNNNIFSKYEFHGTRIKKIDYLNKNFSIDISTKDIFNFCIDDYRKNKSEVAYNIAMTIALNNYSILFKSKNNIYKTNFFYNKFLNIIKDSSEMNSTFSRLPNYALIN